MAGNSFGRLFKISTFGESHGGAVGVVIDGCPSGIAISEAEIQLELDRRKPGQSHITSPRREQDKIHFIRIVWENNRHAIMMLCLMTICVLRIMKR